MVCSPVMHSNSARLVVPLSLPRAGRWRWPAPRPGRSAAAAPGRLLPGGPPPCPVRAGGGRHPAAQLPSLCGSRGGRPPDRTSDCRPSHSLSLSGLQSLAPGPHARTPVRLPAHSPVRPPARQPKPPPRVAPPPAPGSRAA
jgi:hypothetical protein